MYKAEELVGRIEEMNGMEGSPKISVIVPVYNAAQYIERCARSLFGQTLDLVEYIFVDDCSKDDSSIRIIEAVLEEYPHRKDFVTIVRHEHNMGVSAARNSGLARAKSKYVAFCDSDDWMDVAMLQKMYDAAEQKCADVAMCDFYMVSKRGAERHTMPMWSDDKVASMQQYLQYTWNVIWNLLIKRETLAKYDMHFAQGRAYCEDFNFAVKLLDRATVVVNVAEPLYYYNCMNTGSAIHNLGDKTMRDEQTMYIDIINLFKDNGTFVNYKKQMGWRILKSKQELVLDTKTYHEFMELYPESHAYILSCPWLNVKLKIMMWCLVHHLRFVSVAMLWLRHVKMQLQK